jgi:hypothetical protein
MKCFRKNWEFKIPLLKDMRKLPVLTLLYLVSRNRAKTLWAEEKMNVYFKECSKIHG